MGQAPAASDVTRMPYPAAGADGARSRWLIVGLVATLVAAIVVIAVLGHRLLTRPQTAVATVAPAAPAAMAPAPSAPIRSTAAVPVPPREAPVKPAIAANDAINSLSDVAPAPVDAAPPQPAAPAGSGHARLITPAGSDGGGAAATPRTVAPAIPAPSPATAPGAAGNATDSAAGDAADDATDDTTAAAAAAPAAASPAFPSPPAEPAIPPGLHQLEGAFRAQFPDLNVAVHAYNPNRQQSFVIIDNHTYHEGEALPQGPVIDQIVPEGIVFDWKGRKVLYALNR
jgi:hypothetical protein